MHIFGIALCIIRILLLIAILSCGLSQSLHVEYPPKQQNTSFWSCSPQRYIPRGRWLFQSKILMSYFLTSWSLVWPFHSSSILVWTSRLHVVVRNLPVTEMQQMIPDHDRTLFPVEADTWTWHGCCFLSKMRLLLDHDKDVAPCRSWYFTHLNMVGCCFLSKLIYLYFIWTW